MSKFVEVNTDYIDENGVQHIDGLKLEYEKTAQSKYKDVVEPMKMLQINDNAIPHAIAVVMYLGLAFIDNDSELGEVIYYGNVFETIRDNDEFEIPTKFKDELNDLIELCKEYQYVMVTKI